MKPGTIIAFVAVAMLTCAVGCKVPNELKVAEANVATKIRTVKHTFRGSSFPISEAGGGTATLHSFLAKGGSGIARVNALLVYKTHVPTTDAAGNLAPPETDDRCPDTCGKSDRSCKFGVDLVSMTWVQTYNDGSAFSGAVPNDPSDKGEYETYYKRSFVCTNGSDFYIDVTGKIVDGIGTRFRDLKEGGYWNATATTSVYMTDGVFNATLVYE